MPRRPRPKSFKHRLPSPFVIFSQSNLACIILDSSLYDRNPSLVQLLNGTIHSNNSRRLGASLGKQRQVYFRLVPDGPLLLFPSTASIQPLPLSPNNTDNKRNLLVKFVHSHIEKESSLTMIIQDASTSLIDLLLALTGDPIRTFAADHLSKLTQSLPSPAYREILLPCRPPSELGGENLVRQFRPPPPPPSSGQPHQGPRRHLGSRANKKKIVNEEEEDDQQSSTVNINSQPKPTLLPCGEDHKLDGIQVCPVHPLTQPVPIKKRKYLALTTPLSN